MSDTRIKLITNEINLGLIKTLNKGIDLAKGKYIARMDADDISATSRIEQQVNFLEKNKEISIIGSNSYAINGGGRVLKKKSFMFL